VLELLGARRMGVVYQGQAEGPQPPRRPENAAGGNARDTPGAARFRIEVEAAAPVAASNIRPDPQRSARATAGPSSRWSSSRRHLARQLGKGMPSPRQAAQTLEALARAVHMRTSAASSTATQARQRGC